MFASLKRAIWKAGLFTMLLSLLGFTIALAAAGDLDITFSSDGKQTTDISGNWNDMVHGIALQADGKIVAVGDRYDPAKLFAISHNFALARYNKNGSLDTTFSTDGKQTTDFGGWDRASAVVVQSDGKIVVSGVKCTSSCDLAVARYNANGSLDTTFSGDGKQVVAHGSGDNGSYGGLAIQGDGRIVVAGYMQNGSGDYDFAVYRLNSNGSLDTTFSADGKQNFGFGAGRIDQAYNLRLQSGKIVVAGYTCDDKYSSCNFAVARLNPSGNLDTTFSADGKQTTDFGADDYAYAVAVQSDGKIVAVGEKWDEAGESFAVARYNPGGALDTTFSSDGKQTINFGSYAWANAVVVQSNGKIVVAGVGDNGANPDFALARLNPNGSLDTTFGASGKTMIDFGGTDHAHGLLRQLDGKYVLSGYTYGGTQSDFALARVLP